MHVFLVIFTTCWSCHHFFNPTVCFHKSLVCVSVQKENFIGWKMYRSPTSQNKFPFAWIPHAWINGPQFSRTLQSGVTSSCLLDLFVYTLLLLKTSSEVNPRNEITTFPIQNGDPRTPWKRKKKKQSGGKVENRALDHLWDWVSQDCWTRRTVHWPMWRSLGRRTIRENPCVVH